MLRKIFISLAVLLLFSLGTVTGVYAQQVQRVEPPCWWTDMHTDLQLMIYGKNLQNSAVNITERNEGLFVKAVHNAENPNYLFVDLGVAKAGKYTLEISKGKTKTKIVYEIFSRRPGSKQRKGFNSSDVIYLIMPDRFSNGDTTNDRLKTSDQKLDRTSMEDRHGGDIQGIIDRLDYLKDLGVTSIWSTPMLEDKLHYHQYGVSDYYKIDPHFGTNELYKKMVSKAHDKGLKIIQDVTPNHCGISHWWINDPPFRNWFNSLDLPANYELFSLESLSDPHASQIDQNFCGSTILYKSMPDMNLLNPYVLQYMTQFAVWWIEFADLDGLRVDTYFYMGKIAAQWTKNILKEYPNFTLVGEVWGTEQAIVAYWLGSTPNTDGFSSALPMVMDFPLQAAIATDFTDDKAHWGGKMRTIYNAIAQDFVYKNPELSQVIFAGNHDTERIYKIFGKNIAKIKMIFTLLTTMRGLPQFYYGDEILFDEDARGGPHANRVDFYGGWANDTLNLFAAEHRNPDSNEAFNHLRTLLNFRKQTPVLHEGKLMHYIPLDGVYTYFRYSENDCVMVVINASLKEQTIDWKRFEERLLQKQKGKDILTGNQITKFQAVKIPPQSSMVINFDK
ncbi:MAG: cyclomaltodextrinase C-terminal domain-containing protein [Prevotellaceae bacterium]|jgi:glycosidase|nr:cyclomaltodextrinase C-terminal domain-containing protein [Prevotellaceae bacterium]